MARIAKRKTVSGDVRYDVQLRIRGRQVSKTFTTKKAATAWANSMENDRAKGIAIDPKNSQVSLKTYANEWLAQRHDLAARTAELYRWILDRHIFPLLEDEALCDITPSLVRAWNAGLAKEHPATASKAYRLLSTIMKTAVADEVIVRSPCVVKGAASERAAERPVASVAEVQALEMQCPRTFESPSYSQPGPARRAELLGAPAAGRGPPPGQLDHKRYPDDLYVRGNRGEARKPRRAVHTVAIPSNIVTELTAHLDTHVASGAHVSSFRQRQDAPARLGSCPQGRGSART